jgi:hypothetical protein
MSIRMQFVKTVFVSLWNPWVAFFYTANRRVNDISGILFDSCLFGSFWLL